MRSIRHVVVVGAGNAALCAALSARERGAAVSVLERAPLEERGGNSAFTAGAMRVAYDGIEDLMRLMPDLTDDEIANTDFGIYQASAFLADFARVTGDRCDPELAETVCANSLDTLLWMREQGVRFLPLYGAQAFRVGDKFRFWGGLTIQTSGGGRGLIDSLARACERVGIAIQYGARVVAIRREGGRAVGVTVDDNGTERFVPGDAVVIASGGFESSAELRARYLGPDWDLVPVRGTAHNLGEGLLAGLAVGASPAGNWSGCHAVAWDRNAPEFGDRVVADQFQKHSYPFGMMINAEGERFVDEGADFRNYTYAKYGRAILAQPLHFAWQIFDEHTSHLLRDEYRIREVTRVQADSIEGLAQRMGIDTARFTRTVEDFNAAVMTDVAFDPTIKDGRGTRGLTIPKSNWANPLDAPPYRAFAVTCGITFTFGGLRINSRAEVLDTYLKPIPGLYAAGEVVGGLFYSNYPGGSGLTSGAVFGRISGAAAASSQASE